MSLEPKSELPEPGSPRAIKLGCDCPMYDNNFGKGAQQEVDGAPIYYITNSCIIHGTPPKKDKRRGLSDKAKW